MKIFKNKAQREADKAQKRLEQDRSKVRKPDDIQRQYHQLAAELGDKQYKRHVLGTEIEQLNKTMHSLNLEFYRASQVHAAEATPAPAAPTTEPANAPQSV